MSGLRDMTLGELLRVKHGFAFKGEHFAESGDAILLTPGNFNAAGGLKLKGERERYYAGPIPPDFVLQKGDMLVAMTDLTQNAPILGSAAIIPESGRFLHNQRLGKIVNINMELTSRDFLYYLFNSAGVRAQIRASATGATVKHTAPERIYAVRVEVPDDDEQRRIVRVLSAYDDLIRNCERRIGVLDEMARTLYREWFLSDAVARKQVLAQRLIDEGVLEINDGYRAKNSELGPTGLPFARAGNLDAGFHFDDADIVAPASVAKAGSKISRVGDVVFTSKGTVGRFAKVRAGTRQFVYSPQLCFWRILDENVLSPNYLFRWMQSREFLDQVDRVKGSTDMADYVSLTEQRRMTVRVPNSATLRRAEAVLGPIDDLMGNITRQVEVLRSTRDLLLPRLLSGQLKLADAA